MEDLKERIKELRSELRASERKQRNEAYAVESKWVGKLCYVWDDPSEKRLVTLVQVHKNRKSNRFQAFPWAAYNNCRPLTREEVERLLYKE